MEHFRATVRDGRPIVETGASRGQPDAEIKFDIPHPEGYLVGMRHSHLTKGVEDLEHCQVSRDVFAPTFVMYAGCDDLVVALTDKNGATAYPWFALRWKDGVLSIREYAATARRTAAIYNPRGGTRVAYSYFLVTDADLQRARSENEDPRAVAEALLQQSDQYVDEIYDVILNRKNALFFASRSEEAVITTLTGLVAGHARWAR